MGPVNIDVAGLYGVSEKFDAIAQLADHGARVPLTFGSASAGRRYLAEGDAVRRAVGWRIAELAGWARAARQTAAGLRCGADRYVQADDSVTGRLG